MVAYLSDDELAAINREVLKEVKVKKADKFEVLSKLKLSRILENTEAESGDISDKAVTLLKGLVQEHPFASGNRRTAIVAIIKFLKINGQEITLKHEPRTLQGIRENFYKDEEIKKWLMGGEIREFKRK